MNSVSPFGKSDSCCASRVMGSGVGVAIHRQSRGGDTEFRHRWILWIALGVVGISVAACAMPQKAELDDFQGRATRGPLAVYWNCNKEPGKLTVEGVAVQMIYPSPTRELKFRIEGVDARGALVSSGAVEARDYIMHQMEQNPFRVTVQTVGTEAHFNLEYKYWLHVAGSSVDADSEDHEYVAKNICPAGNQAAR